MQQPNEIWKDIQGYEGLYQVSTLGRVRSLDRLIKSRYGNFRKIIGKIIKPNKYGVDIYEYHYGSNNKLNINLFIDLSLKRLSLIRKNFHV